MARIKNWKKYAPTTFVDSAESMDSSELKNVILESADQIERTNKEMDLDASLKHVLEQKTALEGGYKDTVRAFQAKIVGAIEILNERGAPVSN